MVRHHKYPQALRFDQLLEQSLFLTHIPQKGLSIADLVVFVLIKNFQVHRLILISDTLLLLFVLLLLIDFH